MANVTMKVTYQPAIRKVYVIDSFHQSSYQQYDSYEHAVIEAVIDGVTYSESQTKQAMQDASYCRCEKCIACTVASEYVSTLQKLLRQKR